MGHLARWNEVGRSMGFFPRRPEASGEVRLRNSVTPNVIVYVGVHAKQACVESTDVRSTKQELNARQQTWVRFTGQGADGGVR